MTRPTTCSRAGVQRFAQDADARLDELRGRLLAGEYLPARLARVSIPQGKRR
ncbi:MAG: hypothetical protein ACRDS1_17150 [Pseudonocardiaceae bacterium]